MIYRSTDFWTSVSPFLNFLKNFIQRPQFQRQNKTDQAVPSSSQYHVPADFCDLCCHVPKRKHQMSGHFSILNVPNTTLVLREVSFPSVMLRQGLHVKVEQGSHNRSTKQPIISFFECLHKQVWQAPERNQKHPHCFSCSKTCLM